MPDMPTYGDDSLNLGVAGYFALILVGAVVILIIVVVGCAYLRQRTSRTPEERNEHRDRITQMSHQAMEAAPNAQNGRDRQQNRR